MRKSSWILFPAIALLHCSCSPVNEATDERSTDPIDLPAEEDVLLFADELSGAVAAGDISAINRHFNWPRIVENATDDVPSNERLRNEFSRGVVQATREKGLSVELAYVGRHGGDYSLVRVTDADSQRRALFRLIPPGGGVNYHEVVLEADPNETLKVADIYIYALGEYLSDTLRRFFLAAVASEDRGFLDRVSGKDNEYVESLDSIDSMSQARERGDYATVLRIYDELPPVLQRDKGIFMTRIEAASFSDDEIYIKALDEYIETYPGDPSADLHLIDALFLRQDFNGALEAINRLDESIGGDPYLLSLRANIHFEKGDINKAWENANEAVEKLPDNEWVYWTGISIAMEEQRWDRVKEYLLAVEDRFGHDIQQLLGEPFYQPFTDSEEYQELIHHVTEHQ